MVVHCLVCKNNRSSSRRDISYHRFPKDEDAAAKWMVFCGLQVGEVYKSNTICSDHFIQDDFICYDATAKGGRRELKKGRIPSVKKKDKRRTSTVATMKPSSKVASIGLDEEGSSAMWCTTPTRGNKLVLAYNLLVSMGRRVGLWDGLGSMVSKGPKLLPLRVVTGLY